MRMYKNLRLLVGIKGVKTVYRTISILELFVLVINICSDYFDYIIKLLTVCLQNTQVTLGNLEAHDSFLLLVNVF